MTKADDDKLMKSISAQLKHSKLDDATLKSVFQTAQLIQSHARVTRVFPEGTLAPDGIGVEAEFTDKQMAVIGELLKRAQDIRDLKVFPVGILEPERFRMIVNVR